MSEPEDVEIPLTKQKRHYEKTPAREEAIKKMMEARQKNIELKNAQKVLQSKAVIEKHQLKTDQPVVERKVKKPVVEKEESESEDEEPEIIVVKKSKPKPRRKQIIIEESDSSEDEPIVVKKKTPKEPTLNKRPSSVLQVQQPAKPATKDTPAEEKMKIDPRSFFA